MSIGTHERWRRISEGYIRWVEEHHKEGGFLKRCGKKAAHTCTEMQASCDSLK